MVCLFEFDIPKPMVEVVKCEKIKNKNKKLSTDTQFSGDGLSYNAVLSEKFYYILTDWALVAQFRMVFYSWQQ